MTVETVLRRIERECRENIRAYENYKPRWRGNKGSLMKGAVAESRGVVDTCNEFRTLCCALRHQHRNSNARHEPARR